MAHRLVGLLAATTAAPYLLALCMVLIEPLTFDRGWSLDLAPSVILSVGTASLLVAGPPTLILSGLLALLLKTKRWEARWQFILSGAGLGVAEIGTAMLVFDSLKNLIVLMLAGLAGAICGWIYWRIATTGHQSL